MGVDRVVDRLGQADVDPAYGVDHVLETGEIDLHEVVDAHPRELLDGLDRAGRPADG